MNARRTAALILAAAALMTLNAGAYAENAPDIPGFVREAAENQGFPEP